MDVPDLQIALIDRCARCLVRAGEIDEGIDAVVVYDDSSHARRAYACSLEPGRSGESVIERHRSASTSAGVGLTGSAWSYR
jgi:hypothetical protein